MDRTVSVLIAAYVLSALCCGCPSKSGARTAETVLIFGRGADSTKLDPADITDGESVKVCNQIFETLVTYAPKTIDIVPCLAESWESSEGGKVWTFNLRSGVKFHDGTAFDASAVVFTFERHMKKDSPYRFGGAFAYSENYAEIEKVEVPEPLKAVFTLKAPSAVFLPNVAMFPASIVSPGAVKKHGDRFHENPVGTGPFRFSRWVRGEKITLESNPDWWGGKVALSRVIFKPVPDNTARHEQLKRGEIHMMDNFSLSDIESMRKNPEIVFDEVTGMNFSYLALNNDVKPFGDPRVRRAVAHAIDKAKILKLGAFGFGTTGPNPMPPSVKGYDATIEDYGHAPETARKLLAEAGLAGGFETELWAMPNPRPYLPRPQEVAQVIKEDLAAVGIRAKIVSHPWTVYLEKTQNGEHPMCLLGWTTDNGDPDNFLWQLLHKVNAPIRGAQNVSFYRDDEVSALLDEAQHEVDEAKRMGLYSRAQRKIHADCPMIPLMYTPQIVAYRKEVKGYDVHPIGVVRLHKVRME